MLALSIRQPWASLIIKAGKDIENRGWPMKFRGRILVHAAKGMTRGEHEDAIAFAVEAIRADPRNAGAQKKTTLRSLGFEFEALQRGGFIGTVEVVDCVRHSPSPWFVGEFGFVLRDPRPMPFVPYRGQLGFFEVPDSALSPAPSMAGDAPATGEQTS
jgi:hypothetical protein